MKQFYYRFRVVLRVFALGLASVPFFSSLYENWNNVRVELPVITSESPIYIFPNQVVTESSIESRILVSQERDLSLYEFGGQRADCKMMYSADVKRCKTALEKSRYFILKHWQTKTKGFISLKQTTLDSTRESHIFIEPDKNGNWHIVWSTEGWNMAGSPQQSETTAYATDIRSVKLKRATRDDYHFETGTNYLSFLNKDGEEVESW